MEREKAIEIISLNIKQRSPGMPPDVLDALKLSVKDMEHCVSCPYVEYQAKDELLPGETKDKELRHIRMNSPKLRKLKR